MEELSRKGKKNRKILMMFLKEKSLIGDYMGNVLEYRCNHKVCSINNIFNTESLDTLFHAFFSFASSSYPKGVGDVFSIYLFWMEKEQEWKNYCYFQEYKEYEYDIW